MTAAMEKQGACEDAAKEKDPRYKEVNPAQRSANAAQDRGDHAAADKYSEQAPRSTTRWKTWPRKSAQDDCAAKALAKDQRNSEAPAEAQAAAKEKNPDMKSAYSRPQVQVLLGMMRMRGGDVVRPHGRGQTHGGRGGRERRRRAERPRTRRPAWTTMRSKRVSSRQKNWGGSSSSRWRVWRRRHSGERRLQGGDPAPLSRSDSPR